MLANLFEAKCEVGVSPTSGPARLSGSGYEYFMQRHGIASNSCPQALQIPLHLELGATNAVRSAPGPSLCHFGYQMPCLNNTRKFPQMFSFSLSLSFPLCVPIAMTGISWLWPRSARTFAYLSSQVT